MRSHPQIVSDMVDRNLWAVGAAKWDQCVGAKRVMDLFGGLLLISSLSFTLVTGFILTYADIVMPGLANLSAT